MVLRKQPCSTFLFTDISPITTSIASNGYEWWPSNFIYNSVKRTEFSIFTEDFCNSCFPVTRDNDYSLLKEILDFCQFECAILWCNSEPIVFGCYFINNIWNMVTFISSYNLQLFQSNHSSVDINIYRQQPVLHIFFLPELSNCETYFQILLRLCLHDNPMFLYLKTSRAAPTKLSSKCSIISLVLYSTPLAQF